MKLAIFLAILYIVLGMVTMSSYGLNWDSPFRFRRGQAYLDLIWPQNKLVPLLVTPGEDASRFDPSAWEGPALFKAVANPTSQWDYKYFATHDDPPGHHPFFDIVDAVSHSLFSGTLGELQSFELPTILISALGIFIVTYFTYQLTNSWLASLLAGAALGLYPMFFSESHFNIKDPTQATFFTGALWSIWNWVQSKNRRWFIVLIAFSACALATKWNIVFLPAILLPWWLLKKPQLHLKKILLYSGIWFMACCVFLVLTWPDAFASPLHHLIGLVQFYFTLGTQTSPDQPAGFIWFGINLYPVLLIFIQTPEIILLLAGLGIIKLIKSRHPDWLLFLLWLIVPILHYVVPHTWFYLGMRQFMEVVPALAILTGLGFYYLSFKLQKLKIKPLPIIVLLLVMGNLVFIDWSSHPNENLYFNLFVGRLPGTARLNWVDLKAGYGNVYKQAADWLNAHASPNAHVAFLDGPDYALSPWLLRSDITISPDYFSGFSQQGEYLLLHPNPQTDRFFADLYPRSSLKVLHTISIDNVPFIYIYKNTPALSHLDVSKQQTTKQFTVSNDSQGLTVDLGQERQLTQILVTSKNPSCQRQTFLYIDEFVNFDHGVQYGHMERTTLADSSLALSFPPTTTRYIHIAPQNEYSCFLSGQITGISYLP